MKLLTVKEVCDMLAVKKSTVYEWTALGLMPYVRLNGALRFDEAEIRAWVERSKKPARDEKKGSLVSHVAMKVLEAAAGGVAGSAVKELSGKG